MIKVSGYVKDLGFRTLGPCAYYRVYAPLHELGKRSEKVSPHLTLDAELRKQGDEAILGNDIFVLGRVHTDDAPETEVYCKVLKTLGIKLVFDTDDDLSEELHQFNRTGASWMALVKEADLVTTTTEALAERLRKWATGPVKVLPNCIDLSWFRAKAQETPRMDPDLVKVGVIGTWPHSFEYWGLQDMLSRLGQNPRVRIVIAGDASDMAYIIPNAVGLKSVPYFEYPGMIRQFDIVLCYVDTSDSFNAFKSPVKALEAMAVGAVPICSPTSYYKEAVPDGTGIITDDLEGAVTHLLENEKERLARSLAGFRYVQAFDIANRWQDWETAYCDLTAGG